MSQTPGSNLAAWSPALVPKGYDLLNSYQRFVLCHGPRKGAKSISCQAKCLRHLWETRDARVGVICRTLRNGKVGVWRDLLTMVPEWKKAGFGFQYTVTPRMEADSKMSYFKVRNMYGEESELQLHSLEHDQDVEMRFKDTRFSMIYMVEADKFDSRHVFNILGDQLRIIGLPFEHHQFILDTNPPELGEYHWLHDVFFKGKGIDPLYWEAHFRKLFFPLQENHFISENEKAELREKYRYDKMRYARFVEGRWVRDVGRSLFGEVFLEHLHKVGEEDGEDPEMIAPAEGTTEIACGCDIGDINHAFVFGTKRLASADMPVFDVIDELVLINKRLELADVIDVVIEKMDFWENYLRSTGVTSPIRWRFWSDSSSLRHKAIIGGSEKKLIHRLTHGRINLQGVEKGAGSVAQRIMLAKQMFLDGRLFIGANCHEVLRMIRGLQPRVTVGTEETDESIIKRAAKSAYALDVGDPLKHAFDALTYMLGYENPRALVRVQPEARTRIMSMK